MVFQETNIGEGIFAADDNNEANSERGAFVRNGGKVTVGASSQGIALNIDACKIRIQTTDWSIPSGTVTLADNATAYPRRDLVFAHKGPTASDPGSFEVSTGEPIDAETMQTLVSEGVINQGGTPIAKPEDIPEVQPPAFKGHRDDSTLLAMVYVPPGASDSAAIASSYITDLRMEGIGVTDVLRVGDAIENIESSSATLNTTVANSEALGGHPAGDVLGGMGYVSDTRNVRAETKTYQPILFVPAGWKLVVKQIGRLTESGGGGDNVVAGLYPRQDDGSAGTVIHSTAEEHVDAKTPYTPSAGGDEVVMQLKNKSTSTTFKITGYAFVTLMQE